MKLTQWNKLDHLIESEPFKDNIMTIEQIHGFLCSMASNPLEVSTQTWLAVIFGGDKTLMAHESAPEINALVIAMYHEIQQALDGDSEVLPLIVAGGKPVPYNEASNEQLASWCAGYMAGVSTNQQSWLSSGHNDIYDLLTPVSAFAQFFDDHQPEDHNESAISPEVIREQYLPLLATAITTIYHFWRQHQHCNHHHSHTPHPETFRHEKPKTGRNDPCLCGSGKKFKKCCGA